MLQAENYLYASVCTHRSILNILVHHHLSEECGRIHLHHTLILLDSVECRLGLRKAIVWIYMYTHIYCAYNCVYDKMLYYMDKNILYNRMNIYIYTYICTVPTALTANHCLRFQPGA